MKEVSAAAAKSRFDRLVAQTLSDGRPVRITTERGSLVLLAEAEWRSIQATLHLLEVSGMLESIRSGMNEPIESCSREVEW